MVAYGPVITISYPTAIEVASKYVFFQTGDKRDLSYIKMSVMTVDSYEMSFKLLTGPVAQFRLYEV